MRVNQEKKSGTAKQGLLSESKLIVQNSQEGRGPEGVAQNEMLNKLFFNTPSKFFLFI